MTTPDPIRAALERLIQAIEGIELEGVMEVDDALAAARAALGAAPEGPSLEEVTDLCEEHCFNVEGYESIECLQGLLNDALARWGRPTAPPTPAAGEVGELVALIRQIWWP